MISRWNLPIRCCPVPWCGCPHQTAGDDDRCPDCRKRPGSAEIHGLHPVDLRPGDVWCGEWGTSYGSWLEAEDRALAKADTAACEAAAKALNREELSRFLASLGVFPYGTAKDMRLRAHIAQWDLWWPRSFVRTRTATRP